MPQICGAGSATERVPEVPDSFPRSCPCDHTRSVQVASLFFGMTKRAPVTLGMEVKLGGVAEKANAFIDRPNSAPTRTTITANNTGTDRRRSVDMNHPFRRFPPPRLCDCPRDSQHNGCTNVG